MRFNHSGFSQAGCAQTVATVLEKMSACHAEYRAFARPEEPIDSRKSIFHPSIARETFDLELRFCER